MKLVVFEGPDMCGKTTCLNEVIKHLEFIGIATFNHKYPDKTEVSTSDDIYNYLREHKFLNNMIDLDYMHTMHTRLRKVFDNYSIDDKATTDLMFEESFNSSVKYLEIIQFSLLNMINKLNSLDNLLSLCRDNFFNCILLDRYDLSGIVYDLAKIIEIERSKNVDLFLYKNIVKMFYEMIKNCMYTQALKIKDNVKLDNFKPYYVIFKKSKAIKDICEKNNTNRIIDMNDKDTVLQDIVSELYDDIIAWSVDKTDLSFYNKTGVKLDIEILSVIDTDKDYIRKDKLVNTSAISAGIVVDIKRKIDEGEKDDN